jgi:hypothetical protein
MAILILLASVIVWGVIWKPSDRNYNSGFAKDGKIVCYLSEGDVAK